VVVYSDSEEVSMSTYASPAITDIGSVHELTLSVITKVSGSGDVIVIAGVTVPVPGKSVSGVS